MSGSDYKKKVWRDKTGQFPGGWSLAWDQELGRVAEISNMFDSLPTHDDN